MKINVGDIVTLKPAEVTLSKGDRLFLSWDGGRNSWSLPAHVIASVEERHKVGDFVTWPGDYYVKFEIVAIKGNLAVLFGESRGEIFSKIVPLSELLRSED